jgi:hypothetical protein
MEEEKEEEEEEEEEEEDEDDTTLVQQNQKSKYLCVCLLLQYLLQNCSHLGKVLRSRRSLDSRMQMQVIDTHLQVI